MNPKLYNELTKKYPELLSLNIIIDCDDGWYHIIDSWCNLVNYENDRGYINYKKNIELYSNEPFMPTIPTQIKEKWGTLRIYTNFSNDYINGVTSMAEQLSLHTCELCGNYGIIRKMSWIRVLCDQHYVAQLLGAPSTFMEEDKKI